MLFREFVKQTFTLSKPSGLRVKIVVRRWTFTNGFEFIGLNPVARGSDFVPVEEIAKIAKSNKPGKIGGLLIDQFTAQKILDMEDDE
jgi:hypothetical protein